MGVKGNKVERSEREANCAQAQPLWSHWIESGVDLQALAAFFQQYDQLLSNIFRKETQVSFEGGGKTTENNAEWPVIGNPYRSVPQEKSRNPLKFFLISLTRLKWQLRDVDHSHASRVEVKELIDL